MCASPTPTTLLTTRRSTGQTASEFRFIPILAVTLDVDGDLSVEWSWGNYFDGVLFRRSETDIINEFTGMRAGIRIEVELLDARGVAIGNVDFEALGAVDGLWHSFEGRVEVTVISPSGASVFTSGVFGPEDFKVAEVLEAEFTGFRVIEDTFKLASFN